MVMTVRKARDKSFVPNLLKCLCSRLYNILVPCYATRPIRVFILTPRQNANCGFGRNISRTVGMHCAAYSNAAACNICVN